MLRIREVFRLAVLAVALAAVTSPAAAQKIESPYRFVDDGQYLGAFGGYVSTDAGALGLGPESAPYAALRYGIRVGGPFTLEAEAGLLSTSRAVLGVDTTAADTLLVTFPAGEADQSLLVLMGALRFDLTGPRTYRGLVPYLLFGAGSTIDLSGDAAADAELPAEQVFDFGTSFAGQLGGGIELFPTDRLTLRLDLRDLLWKIESPPAFRRGTAPNDEWVQNFQISAGVAYRF